MDHFCTSNHSIVQTETFKKNWNLIKKVICLTLAFCNFSYGQDWGELIKISSNDQASHDLFGYSVAVSGNYAIVGANGKDNGNGVAYVFSNATGTWTYVKTLVAPVTDGNFGGAVAIDGDYAVVSANGSYNGAGSAYIYGKNKDNWGLVTEIIGTDITEADNFGRSVSINEDKVAVGASSKNEAMGAAYVFLQNPGDPDEWPQAAKVVASNGASGDEFGFAVSILGNDLMVGAKAANSGTGSVYVFSRNNGGDDAWGEVKIINASNGSEGDCFGAGIIHGRRIRHCRCFRQ